MTQYCIHGNARESCVPCAIERQTQAIIAELEKLAERPSAWKRFKAWLRKDK